tara:strand:- start:173730 stop:174032 length:303 start_codon:yes stop_codon:yes gene_type:complete
MGFDPLSKFRFTYSILLYLAGRREAVKRRWSCDRSGTGHDVHRSENEVPVKTIEENMNNGKWNCESRINVRKTSGFYGAEINSGRLIPQKCDSASRAQLY